MTGMEPFVDPLAGGLVEILVDTAKKLGGGFVQVVGDHTKAASALKKYADKYTARYGTVRVLGMRQDILLQTIYTKVRFLDNLSIRQFTSVKDLEQSYREKLKRGFQSGQTEKRDGFTVANDHQFLMVLGGPGAGKSTFLRRVGLEALRVGANNKIASSFKRQCIPVFLELKQFNSSEIDLSKAIVEELSNFGFPHSSDFAIKLLEQGKLLVLLDGLDEVPKIHVNDFIESIQKFVTRYDRNRYIASCRIAAHRSAWSRFRDIELADFDDDQIQQSIHNWFSSALDIRTKTAERCWKILNSPGNAAAKELAHTPLLLTFLCLVYNRTQNFTGNRATLYRKALDLLLEEWAAEKRITPGEIYEGLNTDLEMVLLSEIAYERFINDQLFFTQTELIDHIKAFLSDTVNKPKYFDGKAVLDAIAVQQGILVERAEDVFSFSHLTLQEYLTAQYISQDPGKIQELVEKHLTDQRWSEVFLLISGLIGNAERLLESMVSELQVCVSSDKLKAIFTWIDQATLGSECSYKPVAKRAAALAFVLNRSCDLIRHDFDIDYDIVRIRDDVRRFIFELTHEVEKDFSRPFGLTPAFSDYVLQELQRIKIFRKDILPSQSGNWYQALGIRQTWLELSEEETDELTGYLYANKLVIQCKKSAVRISEKVWGSIEEKLLTVSL
mgnify:CR=1 FL=1